MNRSVHRWLSSVKDSLRRRFRPLSERERNRTQLAVEALEGRDLLTVTATLVGTALTINTDTNSSLSVAAAANVLSLSAGVGPIASVGITDDDGSGADATAEYDLTLIDSITIVNSGGGVFTTLTFNATNVGGDTITATANSITVAGAVTSGNATLTAATGNIAIDGQFDTTGGVGPSNLFLTAANGNITQSAKVVATNLFATAKDVALTNTGNLVTTVAGGSTNGNFALNNNQNLSVGTVNGADGIDAEAGNITVTLASGQTLTIDKHLEADDLKTISLTAGTINQVAVGTIQAESGKLTQVNLTANRITLAGTDTVTATGVSITTLANNRDIQLGSTDTVTVLGLDDTDFNAISATNLTVTAQGTGNITVAGAVDASGDATNLSLALSSGTPSFLVNESLTVTNLRVTANDVVIDTTNGAIVGQQVEFRTFSAGAGMLLGGAAGTYLSNDEFQRITLSGASVLSIVHNNTMKFTAAVDLTGRATTLSLSSQDALTQTDNSTITVTNLQATSTGSSVTLAEANVVSAIAGDAAGSFSFRTTLDLTVDKLAGTDAFSSDTVAGITAGSTVALETAADKSVTQSATSGNGAIAATNLGVRAGIGITLTDAANAVTGTFAAQLTTSGNIQFNNTDAGIEIGGVSAAGDIAAIDGVTSAVGTSNVTIVNSGDISVNEVVQSGDVTDNRLATVRLQATGGDITQTVNGIIQADELGARAKANITLVNTTANDVGEFGAVTTEAGQIALFDATVVGGLSVGAVTADGTLFAAVSGITSGAAATNVLLRNSGSISIDQALASTEAGVPQLAAVYLTTTNANAVIGQTATISADLLAATAASNVILAGANVVDQFTARTTTGNISFTNDDTADGSTLTIGSAATQTINTVAMYTFTAGITSPAAVNVNVTTDENLIVSSDVERDGNTALNNVVLRAGNAADPEPAGNLTINGQVRGLDVLGVADGDVTVGAGGLVEATSAVGANLAEATLSSEGGTLTIAAGGTVSSANSVTATNAATVVVAPGTVTISGTVTSTGTSEMVSTGATLTQTAGSTLTTPTLVAGAKTGITLTAGTNSIDSLTVALTNGAGAIDDDTANLTINSITLGNPDFDLTINTSGAVSLTGTISQQIESTDVLSGIVLNGAASLNVAGAKFDMTFQDPSDLFSPEALVGGYVLLTTVPALVATGTPTFLIGGTTFLPNEPVSVGGIVVVFRFEPNGGVSLVVTTPPFDANVFAAVQNVVFNVPAVVQEVPPVVFQVAPPVEQQDFGSGGSSLAESVFLVQMYGEGDGNEKFWVISSIEFEDGKEKIVGARLNGVELIDELQKAFGVKIAGQFGKYLIEIDDVTSAKDEQGKKLKSVRVRFSFNAETQDELLKRLKEIGSDKKKLFEFLQTLPEAQVLPETTVKPSGSPDGEGAGLHPAAAGFLAGVWGTFREGTGTFYAAATGERTRNETQASSGREAGPRLEAVGGRERLFEQDAPLAATSSTLLGAAALGAVTALGRRRTEIGFERDLDGFMESFDAADSRR